MDETSLEIVEAAEMYPKQPCTTDDGIHTVPFALVSGENLLYRGRSTDGVMVITNYRFYQSEGPYINVPLGLIDYVECKEILYIWIYCKDARTYRCSFDSHDETQKWLKRIQTSISLPIKLDHCFSFRFLSWTRQEKRENIVCQNPRVEAISDDERKRIALEKCRKEAERMGFDLENVWKISHINENYEYCPSYPRYIIIPTSMSTKEMDELANFRYSKRIPAVVWRYRRNGCVIARSSQPKMGILSWRSAEDEKIIDAISMGCTVDPGDEAKIHNMSDDSVKSEMNGDISIFCGDSPRKAPEKKLLIMDARSYTAAVTNRAKGGGYECNGYYPNCEMSYMGLANIHAIRSSFNSLRALCSLSDDQNWLSTLENTRWLHHISGLLRAALIVVDAIDVDERPVLIHCSDGWDRTPQIVALAEIMLDPYYRTKKGFQVLVEREWLEFGHKFADRCGNPLGTEDRNERSPVFLQWLDCIFQLLRQFQCHFEFNEQYLARLVLHTYSCLFGTFICNTDKERESDRVADRTFSVWPVLNEKSQFHNYLFNNSTEVLRPSCQIRCLKFWSDVYVPNCSVGLGRQSLPPVEEPPLDEGISERTNLVKTKSCDDIHSAEHSLTLYRRNSDPSIPDNNFAETVAYAPLQNFNEDVVHAVETVDETPVNEQLAECTEAGDAPDSERTDNQVSEAVVTSNLVLREPAIDGSTDTLVSESGALVQEQCKSEVNPKELCDALQDLKPVSSVGTDTNDLPIPLENVLDSVAFHASYMDHRFPVWCQNVINAYRRTDHSNSFSCSYATPNHSRTPSSGFPATPCDDPSESPNLRRESSNCQVMEFDGLNIVPDYVQDRIKKLILHYKNKVGNLNTQLSDARLEFLQHICRHYQGKDGRCRLDEDAPSLADSASSGEHQVESEGSESSWDYLCSPDHGTAGLGM